MRSDILVYATAPIEQPRIIAGPISTVLYALSSAKDTDWSVTLCGINGNGGIYPIGVTWSVLRARFRNSLYTPELLEEYDMYVSIM